MSWASSEVVTVITFLLPGLVAAVIFASLTSSCGYGRKGRGGLSEQEGPLQAGRAGAALRPGCRRPQEEGDSTLGGGFAASGGGMSVNSTG